MALGGYKFVGYHYSISAGYDSSDQTQVKAECLRMFKCRLRAFVESCAASGAEWEFNYTDGQYSFGEFGNVIYQFDSDGYNFGAFFKYKNKEQYMMLRDRNSGASVGNDFKLFFNGTVLIYDSSHITSACGLVPFTPTDWSSVLAGRLMLRGINYSTSDTSMVPSPSAKYLGFATKGADVIEFMGGTTYVKIMSPDGFSTLCSPSDRYPVFDYGFRAQKEYANGVAHINRYPVQALMWNGGAYTYLSTSITNLGLSGDYVLSLYTEKEAFYKLPIDSIPYAAPVITTNNPNAVLINNDGLISKGRPKVELLAENTPFPASEISNVNIIAPFANGNYLSVQSAYLIQSGSTPSGTGTANAVLYCGWDPSNPDITQAGSWTEYAEE